MPQQRTTTPITPELVRGAVELEVADHERTGQRPVRLALGNGGPFDRG